jgi:hypothetical protein
MATNCLACNAWIIGTDPSAETLDPAHEIAEVEAAFRDMVDLIVDEGHDARALFKHAVISLDRLRAALK